MADPQPIRLSAMHHSHLAMGAVMAVRDGWNRPSRYTYAEREAERVRSAVGLYDISPRRKLSLQGDDLDSLVAGIFGGSAPLRVGDVEVYRVGDDANPQPVTLARLAHDELLALTCADWPGAMCDAFNDGTDRCAHAVDITSGLAGVRIAGPQAHLLLASVTEIDVSPQGFPDKSCAQAGFAEVRGTLMRLDLAALPSYELYFDREFGEYMWDALLEGGDDLAVTPFGTEAMALLL